MTRGGVATLRAEADFASCFSSGLRLRLAGDGVRLKDEEECEVERDEAKKE